MSKEISIILDYNAVSFGIIANMNSKKKKKSGRPVFDSIRKPTAPPGQKFGKDKPEENIHPAGRHLKHKHQDTKEIDDGQ